MLIGFFFSYLENFSVCFTYRFFLFSLLVSARATHLDQANPLCCRRSRVWSGSSKKVSF